MPRTSAPRNFEVLSLRRRGFETSRSPSPATIVTSGRNATVTGTGGGGGGGGGTILFNPGNLGAYTSIFGAGGIFEDLNNNGAVTTLQSAVTRPGGSSKAIRIAYDVEDDGVELYPPAFAATHSLYTRWYMMVGPEWTGFWPVGLKTNRYFTNVDHRVIVGDPGAEGDIYCSTKFFWQRYPQDGGDSTADHVWGLNHACNNMEVPTAYQAGTLFNNGLPYIRAGYWYKLELWMVVNSAVNANDGILQSWVDDRLVFSSTTWPWANVGNGASNPGGQSRSVTQGLNGWMSMWFGGNISAATFPPGGASLFRYEDGYYLSTTLDR